MLRTTTGHLQFFRTIKGRDDGRASIECGFYSSQHDQFLILSVFSLPVTLAYAWSYTSILYSVIAGDSVHATTESVSGLTDRHLSEAVSFMNWPLLISNVSSSLNLTKVLLLYLESSDQ